MKKPTDRQVVFATLVSLCSCETSGDIVEVAEEVMKHYRVRMDEECFDLAAIRDALEKAGFDKSIWELLPPTKEGR